MEPLPNIKEMKLRPGMTSTCQPIDLLPFSVIKARHKNKINLQICNGENLDIGCSIKKICSIISSIESEIWLKAWKRSGLVPSYKNDLPAAEKEIRPDDITNERQDDIKVIN